MAGKDLDGTSGGITSGAESFAGDRTTRSNRARQAVAGAPVCTTSPGCEPEVKFSFLVALTAAHDDQVVGPGQFSHQWCEFWLAA